MAVARGSRPPLVFSIVAMTVPLAVMAYFFVGALFAAPGSTSAFLAAPWAGATTLVVVTLALVGCGIGGVIWVAGVFRLLTY